MQHNIREARLRPEFAELYGAEEHDSPDYPPRTRDNVLDCVLCVWLGNPDSRGGKLTLKTTCALSRPDVVIEGPGSHWMPSDIASWIEESLEFHLCRRDRGGPHRDGVVLIAGSRESKAPGIGVWVEAYLTEVFRLLRAQPDRLST